MPNRCQFCGRFTQKADHFKCEAKAFGKAFDIEMRKTYPFWKVEQITWPN